MQVVRQRLDLLLARQQVPNRCAILLLPCPQWLASGRRGPVRYEGPGGRAVEEPMRAAEGQDGGAVPEARELHRDQGLQPPPHARGLPEVGEADERPLLEVLRRLSARVAADGEGGALVGQEDLVPVEPSCEHGVRRQGLAKRSLEHARLATGKAEGQHGIGRGAERRLGEDQLTLQEPHSRGRLPAHHVKARGTDRLGGRRRAVAAAAHAIEAGHPRCPAVAREDRGLGASNRSTA
mmetsp:Transcript_54643/g.146267  ORF Transcript_54643/g.146267 Transcript_54643/m.146267 type:complete len:237 (+) Transcript_54643:924-1634(+)